MSALHFIPLYQFQKDHSNQTIGNALKDFLHQVAVPGKSNVIVIDGIGNSEFNIVWEFLEEQRNKKNESFFLIGIIHDEKHMEYSIANKFGNRTDTQLIKFIQCISEENIVWAKLIDNSTYPMLLKSIDAKARISNTIQSGKDIPKELLTEAYINRVKKNNNKVEKEMGSRVYP